MFLRKRLQCLSLSSHYSTTAPVFNRVEERRRIRRERRERRAQAARSRSQQQQTETDLDHNNNEDNTTTIHRARPSESSRQQQTETDLDHNNNEENTTTIHHARPSESFREPIQVEGTWRSLWKRLGKEQRSLLTGNSPQPFFVVGHQLPANKDKMNVPFYRLRLFHPDMPSRMLAGGYNSNDSLYFYRRKIGVKAAGGDGRVDISMGTDTYGVDFFSKFGRWESYIQEEKEAPMEFYNYDDLQTQHRMRHVLHSVENAWPKTSISVSFDLENKNSKKMIKDNKITTEPDDGIVFLSTIMTAARDTRREYGTDIGLVFLIKEKESGLVQKVPCFTITEFPRMPWILHVQHFMFTPVVYGTVILGSFMYGGGGGGIIGSIIMAGILWSVKEGAKRVNSDVYMTSELENNDEENDDDDEEATLALKEFQWNIADGKTEIEGGADDEDVDTFIQENNITQYKGKTNRENFAEWLRESGVERYGGGGGK